MAKKPETILKEKVLDDLKALPNAYSKKIQQVAIRGTLDLILCINGKFVAIELKSGNEQPDPLQQYEIEKILKAGGMVFVVNPMNWPDVFIQIKLLAFRGVA